MTSGDGAVLPKFYTLADRCLRFLEFIGVLLAGAALLATMGLMSLDAFLRYFFNAPLRWQYALTSSFLLVPLVCMSLAWGYRTGGYIRIGMVSFLPTAVSRLLIRVGLLLSCGYVGVLAWKSGEYFLQTFLSAEIAVTTLRWPVWLSWVWVPAGLGLLSVRLLLATVAPAQELERENEPDEEL
jgi:TRAP-type C4-dicarboxylate transport system permease small subunit